jgi:hypothetical protein
MKGIDRNVRKLSIETRELLKPFYTPLCAI